MRLRSGPTAPYVDAFADWLCEQGYRPITIDTRLRSLAEWSDWMQDASFTPETLGPGLDAYKESRKRAGHFRYRNGKLHNSIVAASGFIHFLRKCGTVPQPATPPSSLDTWPILGEFRLWMRLHRGLTETTLDVYQDVVVDLLTALGDATQAYAAANLRNFVLQRAKPHGIWRAKSIATSTRAFLRFLGATGRCSVGLDYAIPAYASWQLQSVPRYLEPADIQRVIDACVADDANGLRDRAVILLLTRLGLRASDVAGLSFADIDWNAGRIAVCGKSRRQDWLPLPQDLGDALLRYIREGRPKLRTDRVFTRVDAPLGPLTRAAVTHIARSALRRAGIKAPINGAHVFRHSAATAMLRQGVSLSGVGAVLRHRSPSTTAHYAKVDFGLLGEIAQPWPEVPSC
jgi:site-specific recombinase XerD